MIPPISWLWKQFQGPQISAIAKAIYAYIKDNFDALFTYFNDLTISTANSPHLTTIGALQQVARPMLRLTRYDEFWFSRVPPEGTYYPSVPYTTSEHGLSDLADITYGGKFSDISEARREYDYLSTDIFRIILKSFVQSEGEKGGLIALDDMLYAIFRHLNPEGVGVDPDYSIDILNEESIAGTNRMPGDVRVNLGVADNWSEAISEVVAEVNLLGKTIYFPLPTMYAEAEI